MVGIRLALASIMILAISQIITLIGLTIPMLKLSMDFQVVRNSKNGAIVQTIARTFPVQLLMVLKLSMKISSVLLHAFKENAFVKKVSTVIPKIMYANRLMTAPVLLLEVSGMVNIASRILATTLDSLL